MILSARGLWTMFSASVPTARGQRDSACQQTHRRGYVRESVEEQVASPAGWMASSTCTCTPRPRPSSWPHSRTAPLLPTSMRLPTWPATSRSACAAITPVVNGPRGHDNPQRQGLHSALLGEGGPLNIAQKQPSDPVHSRPSGTFRRWRGPHRRSTPACVTSTTVARPARRHSRWQIVAPSKISTE